MCTNLALTSASIFLDRPRYRCRLRVFLGAFVVVVEIVVAIGRGVVHRGVDCGTYDGVDVEVVAVSVVVFGFSSSLGTIFYKEIFFGVVTII